MNVFASTSDASHKVLSDLYATAIHAAQPSQCLPDHLPPPPKSGQLTVFAIGKAAAAMAEVTKAFYTAHFPECRIEGIVLTRYGHIDASRPLGDGFRVFEAAHPVPDEAGQHAARLMRAQAETLGPDDFCLVLLSGGGSALMAAPADDIPLQDLVALTEALLRSGLSIQAINCVRRSVLALGGGGLAQALGETPSLTLAISDVIGDNAADIASGPTVLPNPTTALDALHVLEQEGIETPPSIAKALHAQSQAAGRRLDRADLHEFRIVASGPLSLQAAADHAKELGVQATVLGNAFDSDAQALARQHARMIQDHLGGSSPENPQLFLSGGEATVTLSGAGKNARGGPNQEFLLAFMLEAEHIDLPSIYGLAADTDGIDGGSGSAKDPAGAFLHPDSLAKARALGLDPRQFLTLHDSSGFFAALGSLVVTGPSFTNVNDFRALLVVPSRAGDR